MKKFYEDAKYIQMCRKAEELQNTRSHIDKGTLLLVGGDYLLSISENEQKRLLQIIDLQYEGIIQHPLCGEVVWLPRQDQLQEIIRGGDYLGEFIVRFNNFLDDGYENHLGQQPPAYFDSFEQLYLAMVMREKFNKTWNNDKECWE